MRMPKGRDMNRVTSESPKRNKVVGNKEMLTTASAKKFLQAFKRMPAERSSVKCNQETAAY
jgi:hypothetical protein